MSSRRQGGRDNAASNLKGLNRRCKLMRFRNSVPALFLLFVLGGVARAQDFGVMESAETMDRGNFKVMGYPILVFGKNGGDNELGFAIRGGYGFTDNFDVEIMASFFDNLTFIGGNAEFWL